jgi:hypothetical protein
VTKRSRVCGTIALDAARLSIRANRCQNTVLSVIATLNQIACGLGADGVLTTATGASRSPTDLFLGSLQRRRGRHLHLRRRNDLHDAQRCIDDAAARRLDLQTGRLTSDGATYVVP